MFRYVTSDRILEGCLLWLAVAMSISATSCASHRHGLQCPVGGLLTITAVRVADLQPDAYLAKIELTVEGQAAPGSVACLGYPWTIRSREDDEHLEHMVIGDHGPCATAGLSAVGGEATQVPIQVMTNGLPVGSSLFRLQFPVFLVVPGSAKHCGDVTSPEFTMAVPNRNQ